VGGEKMPISGDRRNILSLQLVTGMENFIRGFFIEKKISQKEIPEVVGCNILNRFARDLGLKVKVEEITEEPISAPRETPLEIIDRIVSKVVNNKGENNSLSGIESALKDDPIVVL
jgi:hypothetical protein